MPEGRDRHPKGLDGEWAGVGGKAALLQARCKGGVTLRDRRGVRDSRNEGCRERRGAGLQTYVISRTGGVRREQCHCGPQRPGGQDCTWAGARAPKETQSPKRGPPRFLTFRHQNGYLISIEEA